MDFEIISVFPDLVNAVLPYGVAGRAHAEGLYRVRCWNPRDDAPGFVRGPWQHDRRWHRAVGREAVGLVGHETIRPRDEPAPAHDPLQIADQGALERRVHGNRGRVGRATSCSASPLRAARSSGPPNGARVASFRLNRATKVAGRGR